MSISRNQKSTFKPKSDSRIFKVNIRRKCKNRKDTKTEKLFCSCRAKICLSAGVSSIDRKHTKRRVLSSPAVFCLRYCISYGQSATLENTA
ncbi:hypothetical protein L2E82_11609 [Cichorium intybus]|uniref:Uncharacterized protein n=1 Tax=Cichorium intybus TaxID=13427 RepID=A0ACB9GET1_CICIN|nr:hypothetical protein L2E82_11609 [Cichorium intybus]